VIETYVGPHSSAVCRPRDDLDWLNAFPLRRALSDLLQPGVQIVIDLGRVSWIDATGVSALMESIRRVTAVGGTVRICHMSPEVRRRLELVGVDRFVLGWPAVDGRGAA
jgi:stage II sporulation protein AA (anti-sigma F factor antagonist)